MRLALTLHRAVDLLREGHAPWLDEMEDGAARDLLHGIGLWRLWNHMATAEIRRRYRRTRIGPFWTSLNLLLFVSILGALYSALWKMEVSKYLPYLTSGLMVWWPVSAIISESSTAFSGNLGILRQASLPFSAFIFTIVWRNLIIFGHHMVVYIPLVLCFGVPVGWNSLLIVPGLVLVCACGAWVGILVAIVCARFRDLQTLLPLILQTITMVTPIFWPAHLIQGRLRDIFVTPNLVHHFVDIVRSPLLGLAPAPMSWVLTVAVTVAGWLFTMYFMRRYLHRIMYWL